MCILSFWGVKGFLKMSLGSMGPDSWNNNSRSCNLMLGAVTTFLAGCSGNLRHQAKTNLDFRTCYQYFSCLAIFQSENGKFVFFPLLFGWPLYAHLIVTRSFLQEWLFYQFTLWYMQQGVCMCVCILLRRVAWYDVAYNKHTSVR